jgi:hypothetical protein
LPPLDPGEFVVDCYECTGVRLLICEEHEHRVRGDHRRRGGFQSGIKPERGAQLTAARSEPIQHAVPSPYVYV